MLEITCKHFYINAQKLPLKVAGLHLVQKTDQGNSRRADEVMDQFPGWWHRDFLTSLLKQLLKVPNTPQADGRGQNHCPPTCIIKAPQLFSFLILHIFPNLNGKRKFLVKASFLKMPSSPSYQQSHGFCFLNSSSELFHAFINKHMYTYRYV